MVLYSFASQRSRVRSPSSPPFSVRDVCFADFLTFCLCGTVVGSCVPLAPEFFELSDRGFEVNFKLVVTVDTYFFYHLPHDHLLAFQRAAFEHICPGQDTSFWGEVIKNLSYGCIASTFVAWIIDCANTRHLNKKANNIYDAVYSDLKFRIGSYIETWAELCILTTGRTYSITIFLFSAPISSSKILKN